MLGPVLRQAAVPFVLMTLLSAEQARAEEPAGSDVEASTRATSGVVLPEVVYVAPPVYPPEALGRREEADVVLELTIDPEGRVTHATVVGSAGAEFDAAALEAVKACTFAPA